MECARVVTSEFSINRRILDIGWEGAESDCSSDSASILSLCYSSSSFERSTNSDSASERGDLDRESAVLEPRARGMDLWRKSRAFPRRGDTKQ